jgi:uncharacterized membrane protein
LFAYSSVLIASFFSLASYGRFQHNARETASNDALKYLRMSEQTFAPVDDPFALRLLTPWLVGKTSRTTGVAPDTVWLLLTFTAITVALLVVYEWLRGTLGISQSTSILATLLLATTHYFAGYNFNNFWLVDPLTTLALALALFFAFNRRLASFVLVGMVNKETILLAAPLYPLIGYARTHRIRDREFLTGVAAVGFVAVCYLTFRMWAQSKIGEHGTYLGTDVTNIARAVLSSRHGREHLAVFSVFHFLWVVFAYGLYQQYRQSGWRSELLSASALILGCCLLGRLQATDVERVFAMMGPLIVGVAATVLDEWRADDRHPWIWGLGGVYAALSFGWVTGETAVVVNFVAAGAFLMLVRSTNQRSDVGIARSVKKRTPHSIS